MGMPDDAIYVFCNMTGSGETCVYPDLQSSKMPNIPWRKEVGGKEEWYSNMRGASKVTYETVGVVQMTFLRLLSQKAHQNFTFTCVNSAAWYNQRTFNYDQVLFSVSVALFLNGGSSFRERYYKHELDSIPYLLSRTGHQAAGR